MRCIGIDPSTKTGLVVVEKDYVFSQVVSAPKKVIGLPRVKSIAAQVAAVLDEAPVTAAVIEGYGFASYSLSVSVEIGVFLRMALHDRCIPWYIAPPSVLKKYATGKGNADKALVMKVVKDRWGFEAPSDDVVDGYVLAKMAEDIANNGVGPHLKGVERG